MVPMKKMCTWVAEQAQEAMETLACAYALERFPLQLEWHKWKGMKADTRAETLLYDDHETYVIRFNQAYCRRASRTELRRTICHEVAHCVAFQRRVLSGDLGYFSFVRAASATERDRLLHDEAWSKLLLALGFDPAYYDVG